MANPFDTLRGMLRNEGSRGYDNKTVSGGLDKYIPAFEQQARRAQFDEGLIDEVVAWIKAYSGLAPEQRTEAIKTLLPKLPTTVPRPPQQPAKPPDLNEARPSPKPVPPSERPTAREPAARAVTQDIAAAPRV